MKKRPAFRSAFGDLADRQAATAAEADRDRRIAIAHLEQAARDYRRHPTPRSHRLIATAAQRSIRLHGGIFYALTGHWRAPSDKALERRA